MLLLWIVGYISLAGYLGAIPGVSTFVLSRRTVVLFDPDTFSLFVSLTWAIFTWAIPLHYQWMKHQTLFQLVEWPSWFQWTLRATLLLTWCFYYKISCWPCSRYQSSLFIYLFALQKVDPQFSEQLKNASLWKVYYEMWKDGYLSRNSS